MHNVPDNWRAHYLQCDVCGNRYHKSEGACCTKCEECEKEATEEYDGKPLCMDHLYQIEHTCQACEEFYQGDLITSDGKMICPVCAIIEAREMIEPVCNARAGNRHECSMAVLDAYFILQSVLKEMKVKKAVKHDRPEMAKLGEISVVQISQEYFDMLSKDQELLEALHAAGVDNWDGYQEAVDNYRK